MIKHAGRNKKAQKLFSILPNALLCIFLRFFFWTTVETILLETKNKVTRVFTVLSPVNSGSNEWTQGGKGVAINLLKYLYGNGNQPQEMNPSNWQDNCIQKNYVQSTYFS